MARSVGVHEAKTNLSELLRLVDTGEEITITRRGEAVARLVPAPRGGVPAMGFDRHRLEVPGDLDDPLPDDLLDSFES
ncbi:MAG TPA: type II toxin-antitoxin system prevent-host-death family antitoxin [Acidimicrobiales bacterium]|nr:type II toxin-antitoxin system prevent-host-death family antitoxin [Acidimicrobiales bacterium]